MPNNYFQFKQFRIDQEHVGMKVTTDGCLFGAWVAHIIQHEQYEPKNILDVGSGTGLLSLMVAQVTATSQIEAIEINEDAYQQSLLNFKNSPWSKRLVASNISAQSFKPRRKYDLIITNPPFFSKNLKGQISAKNQAIHNDEMPQHILLRGISNWLSEDGKLYIMYPAWEMDQFIEVASRHHLSVDRVINVKNKPQTQVIRKIACFKRDETISTQKETIYIREESGVYSRAFDDLLFPYYLDQ